tara:strand:- start:94 stop:1032 length:939 start_codon:yes stop_codon:yes gene_type:complete
MKFNYIKNKMVLKCYICKFDTDNKKILEKHIKSEEHNTNLIIKKANMDDKDCSKCFKTFSTKGNKVVHELKCKGTLNYNECEYCHKLFVSPSGKSHHRKICKKNPINSNDNSVDNAVNNIVNNTVNNTVDNSVTINNNITNINITIQRNNFGEEDLSYMSKKEKNKFIAKCIKGCFDGLKLYISEVFLNNSQPQNQTIRKVTSDFTEVYENENWSSKIDEVFLDKFIEEIHDKFDSSLNSTNCKYVEEMDLYEFMLTFGSYVNFRELSFKIETEKAFSIDQFPMEKSEKNKVKMKYIKKILQMITEKNLKVV